MNTKQVEETQEPSIAVPEAVTENTAPAAVEVDFARVLAGDEDYIKETNEALGAEVVAPVEPTPEPEAKSEEVAAKPAVDPDEVVETITYRGEEVPVKRSQMKDLLQKGRHLETRLEEVSPLLALAREVPELNEKLRTPEGRRQVIERIRQQEKAQEIKDETPEVEGYDKADVAAVDKIVQARLKQLGVSPQSMKEQTPVATEALKRDEADLAAKTRITLESLRSVDPHYEQNMKLLYEVVAEVQRTVSPQKFQEFYAVVNDPRRIDPSTGRPAFLNFYADVNKERVKRETQTQPAVPAIPAIPVRKPQASGGRLAPGSAISPGAASRTVDFMKLPQDDFNRAFNEALARG
jgi:hypothetical protein